MNGPILVINAVASSIKFSGYEAADKQDPVERISAAYSRVPVWAIPTDEERMIARQTLHVLGNRNVQRVEKPALRATGSPS